MIRSMTAFARVQKQLDVGQLCWEIRSVNHRYLDVSFRLPESFRFLEPELRSVLKDTIQRGKLECQLKYQDNNIDNQSMLINKGMVNALIDLGNNLSASYNITNDLSVSKVLKWPGVVHIAQCDFEQLQQPILSLFNEGITQLSRFRGTEGAALKEHIKIRLNSLEEQVQNAKKNVASMMITAKSKLLNRLATVQLDVPEGRVEQEIALILTRLDVNEELDRLQTHINEVHKILHSEQSAGRKLDFLMQELNREANTLSSKSDSTELTQCAIEMKVLIEQMREQIQNIE